MVTIGVERGSGTAEVYVMSSIVNELPSGSPVIVTLDMPPVWLSSMNSFGLLPGSPNKASFVENADAAVATSASDGRIHQG